MPESEASLSYGRLAAPPSYDDVMYFISAAQWLIDWPDRSTGPSFLVLLKEHAPYSTISAIIGFLWTPDSYVGHYAINFVPVGVFLLGIAWLVRDASLLNIVTCLVGVASVPLIIQTFNEARPDLPWGLAMGLAIGAIVYRTAYRPPGSVGGAARAALRLCGADQAVGVAGFDFLYRVRAARLGRGRLVRARPKSDVQGYTRSAFWCLVPPLFSPPRRTWL